MGRAVAYMAAGALVVGVLAGCTGGGQEPAGLSTVTAEPTPEVTPTPTPTPTPETGVVLDLSDPELGIVFDGIPTLSGDEADVYNWIATFELEYWRTLRTNEASPAFSVFASPELRALMEEIATGNTDDQSEYGGVYHVRIADISVDGNTARGTACDDYSQVTVVEPDGLLTLEEAGHPVPRLLGITLNRNPQGEGLWVVQTLEGLGAC